ncbi:MAG: DUF4249 family protein [Candidatus Kapaibacterium sp.]|nr:MAG: DUF4249 family protein [Candidatus Kapabacteria bacterium]
MKIMGIIEICVEKSDELFFYQNFILKSMFHFSKITRIRAFMFFGAVCTFLSLITSCGPSEVIGLDVPHDERLVINGFLEEGVAVKNIMVIKTLDITDTSTMRRARITDAEVSITSDGQTYPLSLQPGELVFGGRVPAGVNLAEQPTYYQAAQLVPQAGKTYTLSVRYQGKTATATTAVPAKPSVIPMSSSFTTKPDSVIYFFGGDIGPQAKSILKGEILVQFTAQSGAFIGTIEPTQVNTGVLDSTGRMITVPISSQPNRIIAPIAENFALANNVTRMKLSFWYWLQSDFKEFPKERELLQRASPRAQLQIASFDAPYAKFLLTQTRGSTADAGILGPSGLNPAWNVKGAGIGLFIGRSGTVNLEVRP